LLDCIGISFLSPSPQPPPARGGELRGSKIPSPWRDCVVILICHCGRSRRGGRARQSRFSGIASVVSLLRNDITTRPPMGESEGGGFNNLIPFMNNNLKLYFFTLRGAFRVKPAFLSHFMTSCPNCHFFRISNYKIIRNSQPFHFVCQFAKITGDLVTETVPKKLVTFKSNVKPVTF